jgi:hypothetical protein
MIYIRWGAAEGNIENKPGMSHYIPYVVKKKQKENKINKQKGNKQKKINKEK